MTPRVLALALAAVLAVPWLAAAQAPGDAVTVARLDNGITVMVRENRVAPVVAVARRTPASPTSPMRSW
jgi:hypothetical protein